MNRRKYLFLVTFLLVLATAGWSFGQAKAAPAKAAVKAPLVDLNSASKKELMSVPGLSESAANLIVNGRPYKEKDDLKTRKVISDDTYAKIADKVFVKAAAAAKPGKK